MEHFLEIIHTPDEIRKRIQTVSKQDGSVVSFYADETGSIHSTIFTPFPGVSLIYKDVHMPRFISNWRYRPDNVLVIEHCREGRLECPVDDNFLYIAPGDIVVFRTDPNVRELRYPMSHYHAAAIVIHLDEYSTILQSHMKLAGISPNTLIENYLPDGKYYNVLKNTDALTQVFENIYAAPESVKNTYYGLKILESLILLAATVPQIDEIPKRRVPRAEAEMAKRVHAYVMEHPEERYTIDELAQKFSISSTQLKKYFLTVYGMPIQKFMREQKMKAAAILLETTDIKICDVALRFGYNNSSKFSSAFESVIGQTPKQYSIEHRHYIEIS